MRPREPQRTAPSGRTETLIGLVREVRYAAKDGRFAVVMLDVQPQGSRVVIGDLAAARIGETLRVHGQVEHHPVHGERFRVESYVPVLPTHREGLARYLAGGLVRGIGPELAQRIVQRFGDSTLEVLSTQSGRLREIRGLGGARGKALAEVVRARRGEADSLAFLQGLGLGPSISRRLFARHGPQTAERLREDPFASTGEIPGIGFLTADRIARELGIAADDPRRVRGALEHLLERASDEGHTCVPQGILVERAQDLGIPPSTIAAAVGDLVHSGRLRVEEGHVYLAALHDAETEVARHLHERARARPRPASADAILARHRGELTDAQLEGVARSLESGIVILTGGPGTGKTTTVRAVAAVHAALDRRVVLAAPTGRAAKRMAEATGRDAKTLHRLLEWNPAEASFGRDADRPIECDVAIVDETSMLDLALAAALLQALPDAATLVLVGDTDQLPPVGAGDVLKSAIASGVVPTVRLARIFRQAEGSAIVRAAHAIQEGRIPQPSPRGRHDDGALFFVDEPSAERIPSRVAAVVERARATYELDPVRDVQVLTPMRKGSAGTDALNAALRGAFVGGPSTARLRAGDKVMQTANDYEREVWNGDIGWVESVRDGVTTVRFDERRTAYRDDELDGLVLAYATTIHKAQGSEFPAVVVVLHSSQHIMLTRPLFYTALTRAKRLAVVVGDRRALERACTTTQSGTRWSRLEMRLRRRDHSTE